MSFKKTKTITLALLASLFISGTAFAVDWKKQQTYRNDMESEVTIEMTYFSTEYVEKSVEEETKKNLWTKDESDNYKYKLLQQLQLDKYIPIFVKFINHGPNLRMSPFDQMIRMNIGSKSLTPSDYDKRFNFRVNDERDGFVFFPRFNEKGKPYLGKTARRVKIVLDGSITPATIGKNVEFIWDVQDDDPSKLMAGKAGAKLESDRLIVRLEKLNGEKAKVQKQMDTVQSEIDMVNKRLEELQKQ